MKYNVSMDYHRNALTNLCRICGLRALKARQIKAKKKVPWAQNYAELLKLFFAVDISKDNEDIHPKVLCSSCYMKLTDCKRVSSKRVISLDRYEREKQLPVPRIRHTENVSEPYISLAFWLIILMFQDYAMFYRVVKNLTLCIFIAQ